MARKITPFKSYETSWADLTQRDRYTRITENLLEHPVIMALSGGAFKLYAYMALRSAGKPEFTYTIKDAERDGFNAAPFKRAMKELEEAKLIMVEHMGKTRKANKIHWCSSWKTK